MKEWQYVYGENDKKNVKQALLSPTGIFCLLFCAFFIVWFLYDTVVNGREDGFWNALVSNFTGFLTLCAICLIMIVSALGAGKRKRAPSGCILRVGGDTVVMICMGKKTVLSRSEITEVKLMRERKGYRLRFCCSDGREEEFLDLIPLFDLPALSRLFEDRISLTVPPKDRSRDKKADKGYIALFGFLCIPIAAGIAVLALYACGWDIPPILGVFFLLGGCVLVCSILSFLPIVKECLLPLFAGVTFVVAPAGFALEIVRRKGIAVSLSELFAGMPFHFLTCAVVFLTAVGVIGIVQATVNSIRFLKTFLLERKLRAK